MSGVFVSAILVINPDHSGIAASIEAVRRQLAEITQTYQVVLIANGVGSELALEIKHTTETVPDLQVYFLSCETELDSALFAGLENAIGDWVFLAPLTAKTAEALGEAYRLGTGGYDVVLLCPPRGKADGRGPWFYRLLAAGFAFAYERVTKVNLAELSPTCRLLAWPAVTHVLKHERPEIALRALPLLSGFASVVRTSPAAVAAHGPYSLSRGMNRAFSLLFEATTSPMRVISIASLVASALNVVYALYILGVALVKTKVAEGWVTLSLQNAGMFFLYSLMMSFIAEYLIQIHDRATRRPSYNIVREMRSNVFVRKQQINVVVSDGVAPEEAASKRRSV